MVLKNLSRLGKCWEDLGSHGKIWVVGKIWELLGRFGKSWEDLGRRDDLGRLWKIWKDLGRHGKIWQDLGRFGKTSSCGSIGIKIGS